MIDGTPKFSSLALKEITADISANNIALVGKAGFVNRTNGATHGWTKAEGSVWSRATIEKLLELKELMEKDLATLHFQEFSTGTQPVERQPVDPGGLMEHLGNLGSEADQA
jgi:hypothetical protein